MNLKVYLQDNFHNVVVELKTKIPTIFWLEHIVDKVNKQPFKNR